MSRGPIPDKPSDRPTVPEVLPLVRDYYADHMTGGILHVVLDDGNLEDGHIKGCIEQAVLEGDARAEAIGRMMLQMTRTQRRRVYESPKH